MPPWLREPLLHFLVLGGLLFAVDHLLVGRTDDIHTIVVGAEVDDRARQLFKESRNRAPTAEEMTALRQVWLDNEVLYREGLALQVDKGDDTIRERVIFKALSIVDANINLPPIDDKQLREWFETHRNKYDQPARFDFQEAVLAGENSEATVRALVANLNSSPAGDAKADLRVFKQRPRGNLVQSYGEDFAKQLEEAPVNEWRAYATREGWRAMQLTTVTPPQSAEYESLRGVVQQDWTDATSAELRTAAVRQLAKKYTIKTSDTQSAR